MSQIDLNKNKFFCPKCKITKRREEFCKNKATKNGLYYCCNQCKNETQRKRRELNPAYYIEYRKKYKQENPKQYRKYLLKKYNLTVDQYNLLLSQQNNKCKICEIDQKEHKIAFNVDHCHSTGKIRGLLCRKCNILLGHSDDSIERLQKAKDYLESYLND